MYYLIHKQQINIYNVSHISQKINNSMDTSQKI